MKNITQYTAQELEKLLLEHWSLGELRFIGKYRTHANGKTGVFIDIRSTSGKKLHLPAGLSLNKKPLRIFQLVHSQNLNDGEYYNFFARVNFPEKRENFPLWIDNTKPCDKASDPNSINVSEKDRESAHKNIDDLFHTIGETPRDARTQASSLTTFQSELYTSSDRFIFEILQNADDYPGESEEVSISFKFLDNHISILHDGEHFSKANVEAICDVNRSSKQVDKKATGYKGIGFKSVFTHSEVVYIHSGAYSFRFDKNHELYNSFDKLYPNKVNDPQYLGKKQEFEGPNNIPWQLKPIWTEEDEYPQELKHDQFFNSKVGIGLNVGDTNIKEFIPSVEKLLSEPRFLLFLRHISQLWMYFGHQNQSKIFIDRQEGQIDIRTEESILSYLTPKKPFFIDKEDQRDLLEGDNKVPQKLKDNPEVYLNFGVPIHEGEIVAENDSILFSFLPTEHQFPFPFLVNSNFVLSSNREQIQKDNKWNLLIFEQIGPSVLKWIREVIEDKPDLSKNALCLLPELLDDPHQELLSEAFNKGLKEGLDRIEFLPSIDKGFQSLKDTVVDKTGLYELLGKELFNTIFNITQAPLSDNFKHINRLEKLMNETGLGTIISFDNLKEQSTNESLTVFLRNPRQNARFIEHLRQRSQLHYIKDLPLLLGQDEKLYPPNHLLASLGDDKNELAFLAVQRVHDLIPILIDHWNSQTFSEVIDVLEIDTYTPENFINHLFSSYDLSEKVADPENNFNLFKYFFKYRDSLTDHHIKQLKRYGFIDQKGTYTKFSEFAKVYLPSLELSCIRENSILPPSHFPILSDQYWANGEDEEAWRTFFSEKIKVVDYSIIPFLEIEVFQDKGIYHDFLEDKDNNLRFWAWLFDNRNEIEGGKLIKEKGGKLPLLTKAGNFEPIESTYLSDYYQEHNRLETVARDLGQELAFLSEEYCQDNISKWASFFKKCGVKDDAKELLNDIVDQLQSIDQSDMEEVTRFLFKHKNELLQNNELLQRVQNHLKIKTCSGEWCSVGESIIGDEFLDETLFEGVLPSLSLPQTISGAYLNNEGEKRHWKEFFKNMGVVSLTSRNEVLAEKVKFLESKGFENVEKDSNSLRHLEELSLVHDLISPDDKERLKKLPLKNKSGSYTATHLLCLSKPYGPKLSFENIIEDQSFDEYLLSDIYCQIPNIKSCLKEIGILDGIQLETYNEIGRIECDSLLPIYTEYIDDSKAYGSIYRPYKRQHKLTGFQYAPLLNHLENPKLATLFWKSDYASLRQVLRPKGIKYWVWNGKKPYDIPSPVTFFTRERPSIPCKDGLCHKPSEVYLSSLEQFITDPAKTPAIDLSIVKIGETPLDEWLGMKPKLELDDCLAYLNTNPTEKRKVKEVIARILEINKDAESIPEALLAFQANGKLPNEKEQWTPINKLRLLEDRLESTSASQYLVSRSLITKENRHDFVRAFNLTELSNSDLTHHQEGKTLDTSFSREINSRLKFIAWRESRSDWKSVLHDFKQKIAQTRFYKVRKLFLEYNQHDIVIKINNIEAHFDRREHSVFYHGKWEKNITKISEYLKEILKIELQEKTIEGFLKADDPQEILESMGDDIPEEWMQKETETISNSTGPENHKEPEKPSKVEVEPEETPDQDQNTEHHSEKTGLSPEEQNIFAGLIKGHKDLANDVQKSQNNVSTIRTLIYICENGGEIGESTRYNEEDTEGVIENIVIDGHQKDVLVHSAKGGILFLHFYRWKELGKLRTALSVETKTGIKLIENQLELMEWVDNANTLIRKPNTKAPDIIDDMIHELPPEDQGHLLFVVEQEKYPDLFKEYIDAKEKNKDISGTNEGGNDWNMY